MPVHAEQILIIDSSERDRTRLEDYLVTKGFDVTSVSGVTDASEYLARRTPDLVIADLSPEEISNITSLFEENALFVPLIAMSAVETAKQVVGALRSGATDFIIKPINRLESLETVVLQSFERVRLLKLNRRYRAELEQKNRELKRGIDELKTDQAAGRQVQLKMLPEAGEQFQGIQFEHIIRPSLFLSGDFLDYFPINEDKVLFYLADVSGHGASSAFVTVLLKNLTNRLKRNLRRGSSDEITDVSRFLLRINKELLDSELGKHVTMFVGIIDLVTRTLTYATGAHYPMPVLIVGGKGKYLEGKGSPVGLFPDPEFGVYQKKLPSEFTLLLFSDGIFERWTDKSLIEKEQMLIDTSEKFCQSLDSLQEGLGLSDDEELDDDVAMLLLTEPGS